MKNLEILTPDVLPNNLKLIRKMKGLSLADVSKDLGLNSVFLSSVEKEINNFSGKNTIKVLKYFDISFCKLYGIKRNVKLKTT
ncbi:MAG: helix-turn-helix domain-containing protein [Clostridiales bacterium]|nr:helix-turn-helix domain-containing protein [Clostridiales bacterium]